MAPRRTGQALHPTKTGFDYFMGFRTGGNKVIRPTLEVNGKDQQVDGYTYDILTDDALRFIDRTEKTAPFCSASTTAPRTPRGCRSRTATGSRLKISTLKIPNPDFPTSMSNV